MQEKVILILVDGMRPDSLQTCGNAHEGRLLRTAVSSMEVRTVFPSVTLPCHISLFHSVPPQRHGILSNTYLPQVRPLPGLAEQLKAAGKKVAFFYNWEELRDLSRPGILAHSVFLSLDLGNTDRKLTDRAVAYLKSDAPDFLFLYLGITDETGHRYGWMGKEYLNAVSAAWDCIADVCKAAGEDYSLLITADHGGHDRTHGSVDREDMTIPLIIQSRVPTVIPPDATILDIAPTIAALMGVRPAPEWEGRSLLC